MRADHASADCLKAMRQWGTFPRLHGSEGWSLSGTDSRHLHDLRSSGTWLPNSRARGLQTQAHQAGHRRAGRPHCGSGSVEGRNRVAQRYGRRCPRAVKVSAGGRRGEQGGTTMRWLGVGTQASAALRPVARRRGSACSSRSTTDTVPPLSERGWPTHHEAPPPNPGTPRQSRSCRLERRGHRGS